MKCKTEDKFIFFFSFLYFTNFLKDSFISGSAVFLGHMQGR